MHVCVYICISQASISSWNSNTSLFKNRAGCWLLSSPFRPVLNTQTSMLMGNPWGPATFVPAPQRMSLFGHWVTATRLLATGRPACCQILISVVQRDASRLPGFDWYLMCRRLASVLVSFWLFVFVSPPCDAPAIFLDEGKVKVWRKGILSCSRWSVCGNKDFHLIWWTTVRLVWEWYHTKCLEDLFKDQDNNFKIKKQ